MPTLPASSRRGAPEGRWSNWTARLLPRSSAAWTNFDQTPIVVEILRRLGAVWSVCRRNTDGAQVGCIFIALKLARARDRMPAAAAAATPNMAPLIATNGVRSFAARNHSAKRYQHTHTHNKKWHPNRNGDLAASTTKNYASRSTRAPRTPHGRKNFMAKFQRPCRVWRARLHTIGATTSGARASSVTIIIIMVCEVIK